MLTTREAALILSLTPRTVRWHVRQGHIQATESLRGYLFTLPDLEAFQARRRPPGNPNWRRKTHGPIN